MCRTPRPFLGNGYLVTFFHCPISQGTLWYLSHLTNTTNNILVTSSFHLPISSASSGSLYRNSQRNFPPGACISCFFASRGYLSSWSSKFHLFLYLLLSSKHFLRFWLLKVFWLNQGSNRQTFHQHLQKWKMAALTHWPRA